MLITLLVITVGTWFVSWSENIGIECPHESGGSDACFSSSAFVRLSWSLAIFSFLTLLLILPKTDCAAMYHDGFWSIKFLMVAALFIGSMWIPNVNFFDGYM